MTHYIENIHFSGKFKGGQPGKNTATRVAGLSDLSHYLMGSDSLTDLVKRATFFIADLVKVKGMPNFSMWTTRSLVPTSH